MKRNHLVLTAIALVFGVAIIGCKKEPQENLTPKITNDNVEVTTTTATFTWTVEWLGNRISVVEVSENEDMSDSRFYGSEEELNKDNFRVTVTELKAGTKYYYRYWVWNHNYVSNKFVMEEKSFNTATDLPAVKTLEVIDITRTSALGQGEILSDGGLEITERGICWGTSHNPTTSGSHVASGQNTSTFSVSITDLTPEETYYVRAYAINANGTVYGDPEVWFITSDAVVPTVITTQVTDISWRTAVGSGEVTDDGDAMVTERGICWSTNSDPTIDDSHVSDGTGTGTFDAEMTGLTAGTTYHVRAYAKNRAGYGYGNDVSFNTADAILPTVTTADPTNITRTTATCGGEVTSDGGADISEHGVCWSTNSTPTISDSHLADVENGMGGFSVQITGLIPNTSYYVCSYAINSAGISYGTPKSFATPPIGKPIVVTTQVTNITSTTATSGGNVTDDGGAEVTERGICWSTEHNPTLENCIGNAHSGTGTGNYTLNLTGLTHGTKYYVSAYAANSEGTNYGDEVPFTTLADPPTVITGEVTNIGMTSATASGNVTDDGGAEITERGVCWSTDHNPTISGSHAAANSAGTGPFTIDITGLIKGTDYYLKAYVKNAGGFVCYGDEVHFITELLTWPDGILPGTFTINENGGQISFSQGNLQFIGSYWSLAELQYDYLGTWSDGGSIDLFSWGTWTGNSPNPYKHSMDYSGEEYTFDPADFMGTILGSEGNRWRTLTTDEWAYVFNTRQTSTVSGTLNARFAKAKVANVKGVILFPDNYTHPSGLAQPVGINETGNAGWNSNNYSATDFRLMEQNGAVFLPAVGYREENGTSLIDTGSKGFYWSSTIDSPGNANSLYFTLSELFPQSFTARRLGLSVRLVRDVE